MTYEELKSYLSDENVNVSKLDTDRMVKVLDSLDNPQNKLNIIHVVGTNGKGSTSTMLAYMLKEAGIKVGLFNSPYISEITEYIKLDLTEISKEDFSKIGSYLAEALEKYDLYLTHFEFITVLSILFFVENSADIVIYEAGLGGIGDATDVFDQALFTIATKIDFDHTSFLGNELSDIVARKLGIAKEGECIISQDVIINSLINKNELLDKFEDTFDSKKAAILIKEFCNYNNRALLEESFKLNVSTDDELCFDFGKYSNISLGNNALYQVKNAITAITVFDYMLSNELIATIDADACIKTGLKNFYIKARFEKVMDKPLVYIDGGHNPDCIRNLVQSLKMVLNGRKCIFITGVMRDKEYSTMYELLKPLAKTFLCIDNSYKRALPSHELASYLTDLGCHAIDAYDSSIAAAYMKEFYDKDEVFVYAGTLYLSDAFRNDVLTAFDDTLLKAAEGKIIERLTSKAFFSKNYSIDDMNYLLSLINNPENKLNVIHIAGTNGKGSTCKMISEVLQAANFRTGLFTSPYLQVFNERIRLNGKNISPIWLTAVGRMLYRLTESENIDLNQFALVTLIAIIYYSIIGTDYVVLETGLGGTYDPTNIFKEPVATGITNIGLDHTAVLGKTVEEIALVKAGIIKDNVPLVVYPLEDSLVNIIKDEAKKHNAPAVFVDKNNVSAYDNGSINTIIYKDSSYEIPLLGTFQTYNAAVAVEICTIILTGYGYTKEYVYDIIRNGLSNALWKGRLEKVNTNPLVFADGGHNPQCIQSVTDYALKHWGKDNITYISGFMVDKDYPLMINILSNSSKGVLLIPIDNPRAASYDQLTFEATKYDNVEVCDNISQAYQKAIENISDKSIIVFCGSIYMLSEVYKIFN